MPFRTRIAKILRRVFSEKKDPHEPIIVPQYDEPTIPSQESSSGVSGDVNYDLILYGRPSCPYCARVNRVIEELGVEDQITRRRTTYGSQWRTDLQNRTGRTQVPCLFINGEPMFESLDIIEWMRSNL